ncbi:MAG TPA: hypothetical protein DCS43_07370 [Verrucomicrobia bacterium]|nr:hypothetical protein [Verrucomicrobiota bacterium]
MANEKFSRTVRIDLMPDFSASAASRSNRNDMLTRSNWSTRQRQTEAATATARSRYEDLLESVYDAAVIAAPSGKVIEVNGRAVEFLGYDREQFGSMNMIDLIDGADESVMRSIADTLLNERFALLQAFCKRNDGTTFPSEIAVNRLSTDNVRLCFFIRDVTLRYQAEETLRTEHTALQTCASGVAICDAAGILGYANPAFATMIGQDDEALVGADIRSVFGLSEVVDNLISSALESDETWMTEVGLENGEGTPLYMQISATASRGEDQSVRGIVFACADITAHKQAETESIAMHAETEARVKARTVDLMELNERLLGRIAELEVENEQLKRNTTI